MHYMNWMGHIALRFCVRVCGCDLLSEWCSSGDDMKKPWMDSTWRTFHSGLCGLQYRVRNKMEFIVRVVW